MDPITIALLAVGAVLLISSQIKAAEVVEPPPAVVEVPEEPVLIAQLLDPIEIIPTVITKIVVDLTEPKPDDLPWQLIVNAIERGDLDHMIFDPAFPTRKPVKSLFADQLWVLALGKEVPGIPANWGTGMDEIRTIINARDIRWDFLAAEFAASPGG